MLAETGIAHTRWATHGAPVTNNAHPIMSRDEIAVVHNGIIENYDELRAELKAKGYAFETQTDTEVIAHLIHSHYDGRPVRRRAARGEAPDRAPTPSPWWRRASRTAWSARAPAARW